MASPIKTSWTLPCMTFTETAFEGHNQHSKSLHKQYRELTKYSQFENDIFRQDFLKIITNNWSRFLSTAHILAPKSILLSKLILENSAGSMIDKAPSQYDKQRKNFASPSLLFIHHRVNYNVTLGCSGLLESMCGSCNKAQLCHIFESALHTSPVAGSIQKYLVLLALLQVV